MAATAAAAVLPADSIAIESVLLPVSHFPRLPPHKHREGAPLAAGAEGCVRILSLPRRVRVLLVNDAAHKLAIRAGAARCLGLRPQSSSRQRQQLN